MNPRRTPLARKPRANGPNVPPSKARARRYAVAALDLAAHAFHRSIHRLVGLKNPAHLAALLRGAFGGVEVHLVEACGDSSVLACWLSVAENVVPTAGPRALETRASKSPSRQMRRVSAIFAIIGGLE